MYSAKILADSISPAGRRLTTYEVTYPRMVHAELMTHRLFSRNSASSRAIPNEKLRRMIAEDPAMPVWWGKNQSGMQAREELSREPRELLPQIENTLIFGHKRESEFDQVQRMWLDARDQMLAASEALAKAGLHKQLCNRLIEPWMFITVIVSATSYSNWFHLRDHKDAQPEIARIAQMMHALYHESMPKQLAVGDWHLPLIHDEDYVAVENEFRSISSDGQEFINTRFLRKVSVGRCARVSYLTHDGRRDINEDITLHDKLLAGAATGDPMHMSPFEHVAQALDNPNEPSGNYKGWRQYRKMIAGEHYGEVMP